MNKFWMVHYYPCEGIGEQAVYDSMVSTYVCPVCRRWQYDREFMSPRYRKSIPWHRDTTKPDYGPLYPLDYVATYRVMLANGLCARDPVEPVEPVVHGRTVIDDEDACLYPPEFVRRYRDQD